MLQTCFFLLCYVGCTASVGFSHTSSSYTPYLPRTWDPSPLRWTGCRVHCPFWAACRNKYPKHPELSFAFLCSATAKPHAGPLTKASNCSRQFYGRAITVVASQRRRASICSEALLLPENANPEPLVGKLEPEGISAVSSRGNNHEHPPRQQRCALTEEIGTTPRDAT